MNLLFVYGTLLEPDTQRAVFGRQPVSRLDRLPGYRRSSLVLYDDPFHKSYPLAVPSDIPGSVLDGKLLEINDDELHSADQYEGEEYIREQRQLSSGALAWVYVAAARGNQG